MRASGWNFLQLYYVTKHTYTGSGEGSILDRMAKKVKDDSAIKLPRKWYDNSQEWEELRSFYSCDDEVLKAWDEFLLPYREARKRRELGDVSEDS